MISNPIMAENQNIEYKESWRTVLEICNACTDLGAAKPRYELLGTGLRVHFAALKSALLDENEAQEQGGRWEVIGK